MFTGIVERIGVVDSIVEGRLSIRTDPVDWHIGESVAVNGCCLTVVDYDGKLSFDLSPETLSRTTFGYLNAGTIVNLERAMLASSRFEGHIVQGHVETTGTVLDVKVGGNASVISFEAPLEFSRYLIDKGSVAVDGISLTVVRPSGSRFEAWIIPHTLLMTNLGAKKAGDRVNLEFDILAKYVERLLNSN